MPRIPWSASRLVILALAALSTPARAEVKLYVAPGGNDHWSGRLAQPKDGDGPFCTLQRARDEIRKIKKQGGLPAGGIAVELGGGVYELAAPLRLTAEDSGTAAAPHCARSWDGSRSGRPCAEKQATIKPFCSPLRRVQSCLFTKARAQVPFPS